jgi:hypothetical protein
MLKLARRLPLLLVAVMAVLPVLVLAPAQEARADIGFPQAAAIARMLSPGKQLVGMRHRNTNAGPQYNMGFIDAQCQLLYGVDLNGNTGALIGMAAEVLIYPENLAMQDVWERIPIVNVSFEQAFSLLRKKTGRADSQIDRIDLASELFMIFYAVQYTDGTRYTVDAITGEVLPALDLATPANSVTPATYWSRIQHAFQLSGADASWYPVMGVTGTTATGIPVGITLLNPATGRLKQVDMLGTQSQVVDFMPIGHLLQITTPMRGVVANLAVNASQFLARIQHDFPGGKMSVMGLQVQTANTGQIVTWNATILTAAGQQVLFSINAMTPNGAGSGNSPTPDRMGDYNCDGHVGGDDLAQLLMRFNTRQCDLDLNGDDWIRGEDLGLLLSNWG